MNIHVHYCNDNQDINELKNLPRLMNKHPQVVWLQNCKRQINYVSLQTSYQEASNPETIQGILQTKLMPKMNNYEAENNSKYSRVYSHEIAEVVTLPYYNTENTGLQGLENVNNELRGILLL